MQNREQEDKTQATVRLISFLCDAFNSFQTSSAFVVVVVVDCPPLSRDHTDLQMHVVILRRKRAMCECMSV